MAGRSSRGRRGKQSEPSERVAEANELVAEVMRIVQRRFLETQLEVLEDLVELTRRRLERIEDRDVPRASRPEPFARPTARNASEKIPVGDDCAENGEDDAIDQMTDRQEGDGVAIDERTASDILSGRDRVFRRGRRAPRTSA